MVGLLRCLQSAMAALALTQGVLDHDTRRNGHPDERLVSLSGRRTAVVFYAASHSRNGMMTAVDSPDMPGRVRPRNRIRAFDPSLLQG